VALDFEGREVVYDYGELDAVVPAYATTVPKAQGSEDPAVVIPVVTQHWFMLRRNLVYTAVTRGRKLVVVVGQPKALAIAANRLPRRSVPRCTRRVAPSPLSHAASPRPARRAGGCGPPHPPSIR
jgi:UvrD-like helicase C-terminal domain